MLARLSSVLAVAALLVAPTSPAEAAEVGAPAGGPRFLLPERADAGGATPLPGTGNQLVTADFDGDGDQDVVVPNLNRSGVVVVPGDGSGGLGKRLITPLPSNGSVTTAVAADVDGDDHVDLVAGTISDAGIGVRILLGNGDGTFEVGRQLVPVGNAVISVDAGDLDGDGITDLAAAVDSNFTGSAVVVALGTGGGRFGAFTTYEPAVYISTYDFDLADVDGDDALDLVTLRGCPAVRLNHGDGTFGAEICSSGLDGVAQVLADLDGDGAVDIATGDASGGHVTAGLGDGTGRFVRSGQVGQVGGQVNSIAAADFDGDGNTDVIASADASSTAPTRISGLLLGRGDGTFAAPRRYATGGDGLAPVDLDGDDRPDVVAAGFEGGTISATLNAGRGRLRAPLAYAGEPASAVPTLVRSADVDADGHDDVVSVTFGLVTVRLGSARGTLGPPLTSAGSDRILSADLADLDGDGFLDLVAGTLPSDNLFVMLGKGNGQFAAPRDLDNGSGAAVLGVAVGDVDGDEVPDIVSNTFATLSVLLGRGDGTFGAPVLTGTGGGDQRATVLSDLTGDGDLDAVSLVVTGTADVAETTLTLNEGNGDGTFRSVQQVEVDTNVAGAASIRLPGDARPDVLLVGSRGSHSGRTGLFLLPTTAGRLGSAGYLGGPAGGLAVGDLDGDRKPDVATAGGSTIGLYVSRRSALEPAGTVPAGASATDVALGDITGSRRLDLVELDSTNPEQVVVVQNTSR